MWLTSAVRRTFGGLVEDAIAHYNLENVFPFTKVCELACVGQYFVGLHAENPRNNTSTD